MIGEPVVLIRKQPRVIKSRKDSKVMAIHNLIG